MLFRKTILTLCFVLGLIISCNTAYAVPAVTGCLDLRWGDSLEQANSIMANKGYKKIIHEGLGTGQAAYDGFFAGEPAEITFYFINNQFYRVTAEMAWGSRLAAQQESIFTKAESILTSKYGPPDKTIYEPQSRVPNTTILLGAKACDSWQLSAGDGGDTVTISLFKQAGTFGDWGSRPGFVQAEYINRSLEQRLKSDGI